MMRTISFASAAIFAAAMLLLSASTSTGQGADTDLDGVPDDVDNCTLHPNGPLLGPIDVSNPYYVPQLDSDEDGYGNACDWDFNNDGAGGLDDTTRLFNSISSANPADAELDMNCDGAPGLDDLVWKLVNIAQPPGPSGLACSDPNQKFVCPPQWP